jgi:hypothetical protein
MGCSVRTLEKRSVVLAILLAVANCGVARATPEADALSAACVNALGPVGCSELGRPGNNGPRAPAFTGTWYAAIAKSSASADWGASWREPSMAAATRDAQLSCVKAGGRDCKIVVSGANNCMSLAISRSDGFWASADSNYDRSTAISKAMNACQRVGGRQCAVVVTPCGRQAKDAQPCIRQYHDDMTRGEAWQQMTPEERAMFSRRGPGNGNCK